MSIRGKPSMVSKTAGKETEMPLSLKRQENRTIFSINPMFDLLGVPVFSSNILI
jgi:hypothetical protein